MQDKLLVDYFGCSINRSFVLWKSTQSYGTRCLLFRREYKTRKYSCPIPGSYGRGRVCSKGPNFNSKLDFSNHQLQKQQPWVIRPCKPSLQGDGTKGIFLSVFWVIWPCWKKRGKTHKCKGSLHYDNKWGKVSNTRIQRSFRPFVSFGRFWTWWLIDGPGEMHDPFLNVQYTYRPFFPRLWFVSFWCDPPQPLFRWSF